MIVVSEYHRGYLCKTYVPAKKRKVQGCAFRFRDRRVLMARARTHPSTSSQVLQILIGDIVHE